MPSATLILLADAASLKEISPIGKEKKLQMRHRFFQWPLSFAMQNCLICCRLCLLSMTAEQLALAQAELAALSSLAAKRQCSHFALQ